MASIERFRVAVFHDHPHWYFAGGTFAFSLLSARSASTSMIPSILLLTTQLLYSPLLLNARHASSHAAALVIAAGVGGAVPWIAPSLSALSSASMSMIILFVMSALTSALNIAAILLHANLRRKTGNSVLMFPAMYATLWYAVAQISPIGYLGLPSGAGYDSVSSAYPWIAPVFGQVFNDWIVASWAVVLCHAVEAWHMGSAQPEEIPLLVAVDNELPRERRQSYATSAPFLATFLVLLALPSYLPGTVQDLSLPLTPTTATPMGVGCVLPPTLHPTLDHFIHESQTIRAAGAKLLLWPEGAIQIDNETHKADVFKRIRKEVPGPWIGVSYEEVLTDEEDSETHRRTSLAVISSSQTDDEAPLLTYHKRHLVPIAESFSLRHSTADPTIYSIPLPAPNGIKKPDWAPGPHPTRAIPITASICLDFAHPAPFSALQERPAIILAPARTWDRTIGVKMFEQARRRADELGSMVLWCDGGSGGVSGVAGHGVTEPEQTGPGSWSKKIAFEYPFEEERRTWFAHLGTGAALPVFWAFAVGAPLVLNHMWIWGRARSKISNRIQSLWERLRNIEVRRLGAQKPPVPEQDLLQ